MGFPLETPGLFSLDEAQMHLFFSQVLDHFEQGEARGSGVPKDREVFETMSYEVKGTRLEATRETHKYSRARYLFFFIVIYIYLALHVATCTRDIEACS